MNWIWRRLASHVRRVNTQVEFLGISEDALTRALRQEALYHLTQIEAVVFCDEMDEKEKIETLQEWFLSGDK